MALLDFLFGSKDKYEQLPNYTPGQMANLNQLTDFTGQAGQGANNVLAYLMQFMDPNSEVYKNFEAPYRQEFEQEIVPSLAETYAGKNALSSSGFGQALGSAGAGLQTRLAALKAGLQRQAGSDILGQYNKNLGQSLGARPFDYVQKPGNTGLLGSALGSAIGGLSGGALGGIGSGLTNALISFLSDRGISKSSGSIGGKIAQSPSRVGAF